MFEHISVSHKGKTKNSAAFLYKIYVLVAFGVHHIGNDRRLVAVRPAQTTDGVSATLVKSSLVSMVGCFRACLLKNHAALRAALMMPNMARNTSFLYTSAWLLVSFSF